MVWLKADVPPPVEEDGKSDFYLLVLEDTVYQLYSVGYYNYASGKWDHYGPEGMPVTFYMALPEIP